MKVRLIDADTLISNLEHTCYKFSADSPCHATAKSLIRLLEIQPTIDAEAVRHGRTYTAHEVAEILADEFGDTCACNLNGNDEWLPMKCELLDACPNPVGVACWEQFLKWRDSKEVDDG